MSEWERRTESGELGCWESRGKEAGKGDGEGGDCVAPRRAVKEMMETSPKRVVDTLKAAEVPRKKKRMKRRQLDAAELGGGVTSLLSFLFILCQEFASPGPFPLRFGHLLLDKNPSQKSVA